MAELKIVDNHSEGEYKDVDIGMCGCYDGLNLRVLSSRKHKHEADRIREEYSLEGYYCVVAEKQKYARWIDKKKNEEYRSTYYAVVGVSIKELQDELKVLKDKCKIEMDFLKELLPFKHLDRTLFSGFGDEVMRHRLWFTGKGREDSRYLSERS